MKYALNNPLKFQDYRLAFIAGFFQSSVIFLVEILNIIAILEANNVFDIVLNFIALAILSEFDDFVYGAIRNEKFKELLDPANQAKVMEISYTTSSLCMGGEGGDLTDVYDEDTGK